MKDKIQLFQDQKIRAAWDEEKEDWLFSVVDVVRVLTEQPSQDGARNYWKVLKKRLTDEGNQSVTNCNQLKMKSVDGKYYKTDVVDTKNLLRLIQSIPSKKAEPFKQWLAQVGSDRLDEAQNPELAINILTETSATELSRSIDPEGMDGQTDVAKRSGKIAGDARQNIESQTGRSVISPQNSQDLRLDGDKNSQTLKGRTQ